jgi:autotransporter-associated beta strand protein
MKSKSTTAWLRNSSFGAPLVTAIVLCFSASLSHAVDNNWTGTTSSDWNDDTNWSEAGVPDTLYGENAVVSTISPNIATITADILTTPTDIIVTGGGRIDHRAGIAGTNGGAWMFVGQNSTPSFYNLADTATTGSGISGFAQGSGTLNPTGNLHVGAWGSNRNGTLNINTTGSMNVAGGLFVANDNGCIGTMNLESGAVIVSHGPGYVTDNFQIGHNNGNGTLNISGGSLDASRNFRVGNEGGTGTINITGGSLTIAGTDDIFIGRDRGTAVITQSGGLVDFNHNTFIGNGNNANANTSGTYNLSAGVLNVKREFVIGREGDNATHTGILNVTGGTVTKTGDEKMIVGQNKAKGTVVQSGGAISVNNELFIGNGVPQQAQSTSILANANDGQLESRSEWAPGTYTVQNTSNGNVSVGEWYGSGLTTAVIPFKLPNFGAVANPFSSASFGVNLYQKGGATVTDLDLYGVRVSTSSLIATTDWYNGAAPDPNATLIQASFLTPASTTTSVGPLSGPNNLTDAAGSAALLAYLNSAYNGGAGAGQFVFLRVSYGSDSFASGWDAYNFSTRNSGLEGDAPVVNFTSTTTPIAPPDGSEGTYTLSGTGALNVANEVVVGREGGVGILNVNGGTITTTGNGNMYVGRRNGTGTLSQTAGMIRVIKEFGVGTRDDNKSGTGTYNLSGTGSITVANNIYIGKEQGASGIMTMTGGTMTGSDKLIVGHNQATGALTQSGGTVTTTNEVYIGNENSASSIGTYTLSGSANLNVGNEVQVGRDNGTGTFNLNGGTVNANKISGGSGSATVNFNGGLLKAKVNESNLIENLDVANVQSGGIKIDSDGFNVSTSQVLTGTGGLEKSGAGQLTLSGANTYAGTTTVTAGELRIEKAGLLAVVDATSNTLEARFTPQPAPGVYQILPGSLAGAQTFSATGLGANQLATFNNLTSTVTVTGEPDSDPFVTWIDGITPNALLPDEASKLPGADPDSDGITNLMEFVLGGSPVVSSRSILPTLASVGADLVLSYTRSDDSESVTTQVGQWSTDLSTWTNVASALVNENGAAADSMSITVPKSNAGNGKLFLRLSVGTPTP